MALEHEKTGAPRQSYFEAIDTFCGARSGYRSVMYLAIRTSTCDACRWARVHLLLCVVAIAGIVAGCGESDSAEAQVRAVIERMELAAEARDAGDVLELISDAYRDDYGRGRDDVGRLARGYFIVNQTIHLLTRIEELSFPAEDEARAVILVGMVGRGAAAESAWDLAANLYRFEVTIVREDGDWKITWARWRRG